MVIFSLSAAELSCLAIPFHCLFKRIQIHTRGFNLETVAFTQVQHLKTSALSSDKDLDFFLSHVCFCYVDGMLCSSDYFHFLLLQGGKWKLSDC